MRRMTRAAMPVGLAVLLAAPLAAAERKCWVGYAAFEEAVKHLDIDACPGGQPAPEQGFCRLGVEGESVILYVFEHTGGEPCLARAERFRFADFVARFGITHAAQ